MSIIATRASWNPQYRDGVGSRAGTGLESYLHHSVTTHLPETAAVSEEQRQMRVVEAIGQQRFGGGISYTIGVFPSGRAYWGVSSAKRMSWHSGTGRNTRGIGIVLVGNYETNLIGSKAIATVATILRELHAAGVLKTASITEYHGQFKATACPGKNAIKAIPAINAAAAAGKGTTITTPPATTATTPKASSSREWPDAQLAVDGVFGLYSTRAYQRLLKGIGYYSGPIDGDFGKNSVLGEQKWLRKLGYYKGLMDGVRGKVTRTALQRHLRAKGLYRGPLDGVLGPVSVKALQTYLNQQAKHFS